LTWPSDSDTHSCADTDGYTDIHTLDAADLRAGAVSHGHTHRLVVSNDINLDSRVNVLDVRLAVNIFLGIGTDPAPVARGDVNSDGAVEVLDVHGIVNAFLLG
jgi:hypothetical protein